MSKNKKKKDIQKQADISEPKSIENVEITSHKEETENTTPIEEVVEESSNNIDDKVEEHQEKLGEVTQSSTSPPIINEDEKEEHNEANNAESEKSIFDDIKADSDKTENELVIPMANPKLETIILDEPLCRIVEVQEFTSDGTMERYQTIEANIEGTAYKRTVPDMFLYKNGGHLIGLIPTKAGLAEVFLSDYPIIPLYIMEDVTTSEEYLRLCYKSFRLAQW